MNGWRNVIIAFVGGVVLLFGVMCAGEVLELIR
jgi:hypothetical protein